MNRGRSALVLGIIIVVVAAMIWLFAATDTSVGAAEDPTGDVVITRGVKKPKRPEMADVSRAQVRFAGNSVIFEATVNGKLPDSLDPGTMTFRWELSEGDRATWILSADIAIEATASLIARQFDYRSSTIDGTFPGVVEVDGDTIRVTFQGERVEQWPDSFSWKLHAELDGDRTRAPSAVAKDVVPDEGSLRAES